MVQQDSKAFQETPYQEGINRIEPADEQLIYKTLDKEREASEKRQEKVAHWSPYD